MDIENLINERLEKYYTNLFIDEIQDFGGHDFNFLKQTVIEISSCPQCKLDMKTKEHNLH